MERSAPPATISIGVLLVLIPTKGELLSSCDGTIKPDLLGTKPVGEKALAPPAESKHTTAAVNFILID
jgi:hypothetical protein